MWRFLPFQRYDPYFKTGLNQALMESVEKEDQKIVFLAGWDQKCVNVGRSQTVEDEVDIRKVKNDDISIVRRQGGGGTTFLTPKGEVTWGLIAPSEEFPDDVNEIYREVCGRIAESLSEIGIDAEHEPINDIVTGGKKISGATLKQKNGVTYVGGTLMFESDPDEMFTYLTPDGDKLKDKQIENFRERVTSVSRESDATIKEARKALKEGILDDKDFVEADLDQNEIERAEELADKYSSQKWIYSEQ